MKFCRTKKSAHTMVHKNGVCALFVLVILLFVPSITHAEYIESFVADVIVKKDATFDVRETIQYVFNEERQGVLRCIPTLHTEQPASFLKERYIDVRVTLVQMDSENIPFTLDESEEETCVKTSNPDTTITGQHTYTIEYTIEGAISYPDFGGAELYWNVTGNVWNLPIKSVSINVSSPDSIIMRERACYLGVEGKTGSCAGISEKNGIVHFTGRPLNPYEGVTIAQALDRSKIALDVRIRYKAFWVWGMIVIVGIGVLLISLYRYRIKLKT